MGPVWTAKNSCQARRWLSALRIAQGRIEIELKDVGCIKGHDGVDVPSAKRLRPVLYALSNVGFSHGSFLLVVVNAKYEFLFCSFDQTFFQRRPLVVRFAAFNKIESGETEQPKSSP
jgi:hypothetical protein